MDAHKIIYSLCCAAIGAGLGCYGMSVYHGRELGLKEDYKSFYRVYEKINDDYYKDFDKDKLEQGMIKGMIEGLDDRFCLYETAVESAEKIVNEHPSTKTTGFQIARDSKTKCVMISEVEPDSPAEKCGLQSGDIITAINGTNVADADYAEIVHELIGKAGKKVSLTAERQGEKQKIELTLENNGETPKDKVELIGDDIIYYKINDFNTGGSYLYFLDETEKLSEGRELTKLIIDLRGNVGGSASAPVELFDIFDDNENTVTFVSARNKKEKPEVYKTKEPSRCKYDTVILISGDTYSSAETLTCLFKDNGMASLVGETTGGKGVYQTPEWLPDGTTVSIVEGYYYVNDYPNYNDIGIEPDVYVAMDPGLRGTDEDIQLQKAVELLS